jgi:hypothetical protein
LVLPTIDANRPLQANNTVGLTDDAQTWAAPGQHGRSYRRLANSGRSGPTIRSVSPTLRKLRPLRANNTVGLTDSSQTRAAPANNTVGLTDDSQLGPLRANTVGLTDDSQTWALQAYSTVGRTDDSQRGPLRANNTVDRIDDSQLGPLRANNTVESVHYLGTPDDSKRCESGSISCGNAWPLPVVLAGRSY